MNQSQSRLMLRRLSFIQDDEQEDQQANLLPMETRQRLLGAIFGHALGDAMGLLSEFMTSREAESYYEQHATSAEGVQLEHKVPDLHREGWMTGDWTEDTDQMAIIMQTLAVHRGVLDEADLAARLKQWANEGFPELGDVSGMGCGATARQVLRHPQFDMAPVAAAEAVWRASGRSSAANGAVARTSILGIHDFWKQSQVIANTLCAARITHADPRCLASCVAVTVAMSQLMSGTKDVKLITEQAYKAVKANVTFTERQHKNQFKKHLFVRKLSDLRLDEAGKMSFTYKAMGAGFWALRQKDYRQALTDIVLAGGDADANGAVAGALLGCRVGYTFLPADWLVNLKHSQWLHMQVVNYSKACRSNLIKNHPKNGTVAEQDAGATAGENQSSASSPSAPSQPPPYDLYPNDLNDSTSLKM